MVSDSARKTSMPKGFDLGEYQAAEHLSAREWACELERRRVALEYLPEISHGGRKVEHSMLQTGRKALRDWFESFDEKESDDSRCGHDIPASHQALILSILQRPVSPEDRLDMLSYTGTVAGVTPYTSFASKLPIEWRPFEHSGNVLGDDIACCNAMVAQYMIMMIDPRLEDDELVRQFTGQLKEIRAKLGYKIKPITEFYLRRLFTYHVLPILDLVIFERATGTFINRREMTAFFGMNEDDYKDFKRELFDYAITAVDKDFIGRLYAS